MRLNSTTIMLALPLRMGDIKCYLLAGQSGFVLIHTGLSGQQAALESVLERAGCRAGDFRSIPGHSRGSVGILTAQGDLYCGDLLDNIKAPALNSIMDDPEAAKASIARLRLLDVKSGCPGHGGPFSLDEVA